MAKKKKKKNAQQPKRQRMSRSGRLQSAPHWLKTYKGKSVVHGYRKHYAVDLECAVTELKMIGVNIDPAAEHGIIEKEENRKRENMIRQFYRLKRLLFPEPTLEEEYHPDFYYIDGYTSGGCPYGVTWEEHEEYEAVDYYINYFQLAEDDIPPPYPFSYQEYMEREKILNQLDEAKDK